MPRMVRDIAVTGVLLAISLGVPASLFVRFFRRKDRDLGRREERD